MHAVTNMDAVALQIKKRNATGEHKTDGWNA